MDWQSVVITSNVLLLETQFAHVSTEYDYLDLYSQRYVKPGEVAPVDCIRYQQEIFTNLEENNSLFVFGAGHASHCNYYFNSGLFSRVVSSDIVEESRTGLLNTVEFQLFDILTDDFTEKFDYIFSSHTIEHFTRDQIMNIILPKCLQAARKAVIFIAPYKDVAWADAPEHRVRLSEEDELAARALKWKRIYEGRELVLWFENKNPI